MCQVLCATTRCPSFWELEREEAGNPGGKVPGRRRAKEGPRSEDSPAAAGPQESEARPRGGSARELGEGLPVGSDVAGYCRV